MTTFGITSTGFTLKRLADILADINTKLALIQDPITGEFLSLADENDPLNQLRNAVADQLSVAWEQLEMAYNQFNPLLATGAALSGMVQLNGLLRQLGESDNSLLLRQQAETAATGYRQVEAIYAAVSALPGVQFCRVYQNSTISTDTRGIPAKSIAAVVVGGDDQAVADTIFGKSPAGVGTYGTTTKVSTDAQGIPYNVSFIRPTNVPIGIVVNLTIFDTSLYPANGSDLIKAALVEYSHYNQTPNVGLYPGRSLVDSQLYTPVNSVPGHSIQNILLGRDGNTPAEQNITIQWNEVAIITTGNITVNEL